MSRGTEYLTFVTGLLKKSILEVGEKMQEVQKDIAQMHDYYWENYTEMDQYGYENFDNRQALLTQVNANREHARQYQRMKKMLGSPFFGSVDFVYGGEEEPETFYIGIGNFSERTGHVPLIYDWRAPVSGLFYDYDKGEASYEAPGGRMDGEILAKWQYKIRDGRMVYEFESDTKIDDDILKQELSANSDTQLKNIVRTIQKEQNAIIRNTKDKILVIQGAAGSGKTSIALHRIAYLLYHDREHLKSSNILILSPNSVFSDYISHVLPELGEENIQEMSFDLFAYRELQDVAADCEDRYHFIEHQIRGGRSEHGAWKQSAQYVQAVEAFLIELEDRLIDFRDMEYRGFVKTAEELTKLFYYKFSETPLLSRVGALLEYFVDEYETLRQKSLKEDELELLRERFLRMYVTTDVYEIYNWLLEDNGILTLPRVPREQRMLEYEDVYPILYLKQRLVGKGSRRMIRHLVIDEMQDYTYLQYVILENMFSCNMTILGDRAQTVDGAGADVQTFIRKIFGRQVRTIEMNKSYRNTVEIAQYAQRVSGVTGIEYLERHGAEVTERTFAAAGAGAGRRRCEACAGGEKRTDGNGSAAGADEGRRDAGNAGGRECGAGLQKALDEVLRCVRLGEGGYETAAVLTMTESEAQACFSYLSEQTEHVFYIDRDSSAFQKGITVTTFYQAKGLEFDQVFIVGGDRKNAFYQQFLYISATRALHELYVYALEER